MGSFRERDMSGILCAIAGSTKRNNPSLIGVTYLTNQTSDASRSLAAAAHQPGDYIVAVTGNRTSTPPALLSGYTAITTAASSSYLRSLRVQYKVATGTSETITWTGAYGHIYVIRDAITYSQANSISTNEGTTTTVEIPNLSNLTPGGFVVGGSYIAGIVTAARTPFVVANTAGVYIANNQTTPLTSKTLTLSALSYPISYIAEFN